MLKSKELRKKAWESLKGKYWMAFAVIIITGLIGSIGNAFVSFGQNLGEVLGLVDPAASSENTRSVSPREAHSSSQNR